MSNTNNNGRLNGRSIILTGAAGNIGRYITRRLLSEGGRVVLTGRTAAKLEAFADELASEGFARDSMAIAAGDCSDPAACRDIVAAAMNAFGRLDVLINNAGASGPKRTLRSIPFSAAQKKALGDDETMYDAAMNLLGGPWNMVRAAVPEMSPGASIVNVSTIFSRTRYFGRIPYAVPKSGLNALSLGLARELGGGDKGIRVNTIFPGPIESKRIDDVFEAMDGLQGMPAGTTSKEFVDLMIAKRVDSEGDLSFRYPKPDDVASTALFLASEESAAFSGHSFEVTNGMQVPAQSRSKLVSWPDDRLVDLRDKVVLILAGADIDEAMVFAERNVSRGAQVVVGFRTLDAVGHGRSRAQKMKKGAVHIQHLDPLRDESFKRVFQFVNDHFGRLDGVIMLPATPNGQHGYSLSTADDGDVTAFVENEIVAPVAFASSIARALVSQEPQLPAPPVTFVTNPDDGHGNRLNEIKRAAVEELIRVWRYEERHEIEKGDWGWSNVPNQLVRFDNNEPDNLAFAADWTATLNNGVRKMDSINLWVPKHISRATGKNSMPSSIQRVLPGLHHGKTAMITGGSLGIGLQLGRYLAMAGARVLLAARNATKLEAARQMIIDELRGIGYSNPEERVFVIADVDVGDEAALEHLFNQTLELFGELDFLINNAGIAGAEEMVVDMGIDAWNTTMEANLISNYSLILKFAPRMKRRGSGSILNVSSYFGGEKYVSVAYPNRADYAVSKAGQRALAEILSRHLGPEIQINATAPGPVDGARLRGLAGAPGLFDRRGRLIMENVRLNRVHSAILASLAQDVSPDDIVRLAANSLEELDRWAEAPEPLRKLFAQVTEGNPAANASSYLLGETMAAKLTHRLVAGGQVSQAVADRFLKDFVPAPEPFFDDKDIQRTAEKIETGILNRLHLHKMPTDEAIGLSTTFSLADASVSGETFHPSGGLKFDRSVTEGEMMLRPGVEDLVSLEGKHIVILGDAMRSSMVAAAEGFGRFKVASITVLTQTDEAAEDVRHQLDVPDSVKVDIKAIGDDLEGGLKGAHETHGAIDVVVSSPFTPLPLNALAADTERDWDRVLSREDFSAIVHDHITHHFRVARVAALMPRCQIVLVTPETSRASTREEFALAMFIKTTMHAFTVTLGVESERLPTTPAVNQVQLTRRARAEEPGNEQELSEELERFVYAVLQCSVPAPSPGESRYLARIFRGNAVTV